MVSSQHPPQTANLKRLGKPGRFFVPSKFRALNGCVILPCMQWIEQVKSRDLGDAVSLMLDILEPVGPISAQVLWVIQPVSGIFGWHDAVGDIAEALEEPGGIDRLRHELRDDERN